MTTDAPPPDEAALREAALTYLARYAATEAGLRAVLHRRIDRWARAAAGRDDTAGRAAAAKETAAAVVRRLVELGLVSDAAYAESRARGLALSGRSRRMITSKLVAKGIRPDDARAALPEGDDAELTAALILARKRRIGPFRAAASEEGAPGDEATRTSDPRARNSRDKELGVLARAGFSRDIAVRALAMDPDEAETRIVTARQG